MRLKSNLISFSLILLMLLSICNILCQKQFKLKKERTKRDHLLNEVSDFADIIEPLESQIKIFDNVKDKIVPSKINNKRVHRNSIASNNVKKIQNDNEKRHLRNKQHKKRRKRLFGVKSDNVENQEYLNLNKLNFYPKSSELKFAPFIKDVIQRSAGHKKRKSLKNKKKDARHNCTDSIDIDVISHNNIPIVSKSTSSENPLLCITNPSTEALDLPLEWEDDLLGDTNIEMKRDLKKDNKDKLKPRYVPHEACEEEGSPPTTTEECEHTTNHCNNDDDDNECSNDEEEEDGLNDDICHSNLNANHSTTCIEPGHRKREAHKVRDADSNSQIILDALNNVKLSNQYLSNAIKPLSLAQESLEKLTENSVSLVQTTTSSEITTLHQTESEISEQPSQSSTGLTTLEQNASISKVALSQTVMEATGATEMQKAIKDTTLLFQETIPTGMHSTSKPTNFSDGNNDYDSTPTVAVTCMEDDLESGITLKENVDNVASTDNIQKNKMVVNEVTTEHEKGMAINDVTTSVVSLTPASAAAAETDSCGNVLSTASAQLRAASADLNGETSNKTLTKLNSIKKQTRKANEVTIPPDKALLEITTTYFILEPAGGYTSGGVTSKQSIHKNTNDAALAADAQAGSPAPVARDASYVIPEGDITILSDFDFNQNKFKRDSIFSKSMNLLKKKLDINNINDETDTNDDDFYKDTKRKRLERDLRVVNELENMVKGNIRNTKVKKDLSTINIHKISKGNDDVNIDGDRRKRFLFGKSKKKKKKKKVWKKLFSRDFNSNKKSRFLNHGRQNSP